MRPGVVCAGQDRIESEAGHGQTFQPVLPIGPVCKYCRNRTGNLQLPPFKLLSPLPETCVPVGSTDDLSQPGEDEEEEKEGNSTFCVSVCRCCVNFVKGWARSGPRLFSGWLGEIKKERP